MRYLLKILTYTAITFATIIIHLLVASLFYYPFNHIHVVYIALLWLLLYTGSSIALWVAVVLSFFLELFVTTPFGVNTISLVGSLMVVSWFLLNVLTNRSITTVLSASLMGLVLYRLFFLIILSVVINLARSQGWPGKEMIINMIWEILLSAASLALIYFVSSRFIKRLNPAYVNVSARPRL